MSPEHQSILKRWQITAQELTDVVDANPSLRGILLGYLAEVKLHQMFSSGGKVERITKYDDHDRSKKGDLLIVYKGQEFVVETKSLQTNTVVFDQGVWTGKVQCDASDRRSVRLPNGSKMETTCLLVGGFDLLAVNLFAFGGQWKFIFAKNKDLPRSRYRKYTQAQRKYLLATLIDVNWPPSAPFRVDPYPLLDEILQERER